MSVLSKRIFALGIDHVVISELKEIGYDVIVQTIMPTLEQLENHLFILTSEHCSVQSLSDLKQQYVNAEIFYQYTKAGVKNHLAVETICNQLGIHYLSPRATASTIIELIKSLSGEVDETKKNIIGVFGSEPGIGSKTVAATIARSIAKTGLKVVMLQLDLYKAGWHLKPNVSLDLWRPRITAKILEESDFDNLIQVDGFKYLPGSYDYLDAQDYKEDEIEYLIAKASEYADVVVINFGSIVESAAWYVGIQKADIRLMVSHPSASYTLPQIMRVIQHLGVYSENFLLVVNRANIETIVSPRQLSIDSGMPILLEIPYIEGYANFTLGLGKKDLEKVDEASKSILKSLGIFEGKIEKKRVMYR